MIGHCSVAPAARIVYCKLSFIDSASYQLFTNSGGTGQLTILLDLVKYQAASSKIFIFFRDLLCRFKQYKKYGTILKSVISYCERTEQRITKSFNRTHASVQHLVFNAESSPWP